mgnify:CR=1 FL=1
MIKIKNKRMWENEKNVLQIAHRDKAIDLGDTKPVKRVGHHALEADVLNAGDLRRAVEVVRRAVASLLPLAPVVDKVLGDLAQ